MKLYERGERNDTLWTIIERNVRIPVQVFGDLRAQLAACHIAETKFRELIDDYGVEASKHHMQDLIDYSERLARAAVADLPDGEWAFEDWIDDDGIDRGVPIRLFCTIRKQGDGIVVDWTGSAPQVKGAINSTLSFTKSHSYAAVNTILPVEIPCNEGVFRVIDVIAPEGTIVNMVHPGACAARGLTGFRMGDCLFGALAQMVPERACASSDGGNTGISIGGYDEQRRPFIFVDFACGTWGGRPWADGLQGNSNMFANMASQSCEVIEAEQPLEVLAYEFISDRAGAGEFRGGAPYRRTYRFAEHEGILQVRSDRRAIRPFGLYGGRAGKASTNVLTAAGTEEELPSKFIHTLRRGDVFSTELAGGGGWGDPMRRDPEAVAADVRNELVSVAAARAEYGVIIDPSSGKVDVSATEALRSSTQSQELADVRWD